MAFADHLWTHTYTNMVKVPSDQFQPIQTIVPSVRTYKSTYISEKKTTSEKEKQGTVQLCHYFLLKCIDFDILCLLPGICNNCTLKVKIYKQID